MTLRSLLTRRQAGITLASLAFAAASWRDAFAAPQQLTLADLERVAKEAKGFNVGSVMNQRVVYVFFDPQCPHCTAFWDSIRPLRPQARFVWIPIGMLNQASVAQGASFLAAADPVALMEEHEASMKKRAGGITAVSGIDAQRKLVQQNTELHKRLGFETIPAIVARHAKTGQLVTWEGTMHTAAVAQRLGLVH